MLRVLLSLALITFASATAFAKPKVAILGLEVIGAVDAGAITVARHLTDGMRDRAKVGSGPYTLAPNSDRELIDEKVIKQCETEALACMSDIGKDMDADVLVYGNLEKDGGGFQATIVMLDVKKRTTIKTTFVAVPPNANNAEVTAIAKKTYLELAPAASGTARLVIRTNVYTGSVLVDDEPRGTLSDGRATLTLPEGRYRIAIESEGYKRKELTIKLIADDSATETFELAKVSDGGDGGGINPWKPIFGVTAAAAIGLGVYSAYKWNGSRDPDLTAGEEGAIMAISPGPIDNDDCTSAVLAAPGVGQTFKDSCAAYDLHVKTAVAGGIVGGIALVAGYFAFIHSSEKQSSASASISVTPTFSAQGGGAELRIDW